MNALHEVRAYSAIANDGLMPHLRLIKNAPPVPPQRAISAHTARELRRMLETVIEPGGSATRAAIHGYVVAGKTGTARKLSDTEIGRESWWDRVCPYVYVSAVAGSFK